MALLRPVPDRDIGREQPESAGGNPASNERITVRITHARDYLSQGPNHIEVQSIKPTKAPLPITEAGPSGRYWWLATDTLGITEPEEKPLAVIDPYPSRVRDWEWRLAVRSA